MQQLRAGGGALQHAARALLRGEGVLGACSSGSSGPSVADSSCSSGAAWWAPSWRGISASAGAGSSETAAVASGGGSAVADDGAALARAHGAPEAGSSSSSSSSSSGGDAAVTSAEPHSSSGGGAAAAAAASPAPAPASDDDERMASLMRVLLHPISRTRRWMGQLSPHLVHVNGQLFVEPHAVLTSMLRALHVVRGVLQEDGHVYVLETHPLLKPLLREAGRSCVNPNVWFQESSWSRGALTNAESHRRLFLPAHQPNRRLFMEKGVRMVNPHCPQPRGPPPRLDWRDKWALYARSHRPGYRDLLEAVMTAEHDQHRLKPPRMLAGRGRDLRLLVVLDTSRNAIALQEAAQRGIPTIALASGQADMSSVTYPVLARDFSPGFVHFFLDMLVKVANYDPATQA